MEKSFFYTYMKDYSSRIFCRGYINGKRFNRVVGGYPKICSNNKNKCNYEEDDITRKLSAEHHNYSYMTSKMYIPLQIYNELRGLLSAHYCGSFYKGTRFDCKFNPTNKTDIFGNRMVEIEYPICQNLELKRKLSEDFIDVYDNIDECVKLRHDFSERPDWKVDYDAIKIAFLDIETETKYKGIDTQHTPEVINVITLKIKGGKIYTWCLGEFNTNDTNIEVYKFTNEKLMLKSFIDKWCELDIDVLSDWNGLSFDIPYIVNRIKFLLGGYYAKLLSPFHIINEKRTKNRFGKEYITYDILGINHLDYMELYLNFNHTPRDSYSLNNICQAEIGKGKLDYSEYGTLGRLYEQNFQKFVEYNIRDVTIIEELDDKLQMIRLALGIGYKCKCGFDEVSSQIRSWDCFIYSKFQDKGFVIPPRREISEEERGQLMGGYVKLPETGIYSNIVSFDVNSLYPTIIRQLNLSPETITDEVDIKFQCQTTYKPEDDLHNLGALIECTYDTSYLKERNLCLTCNGNLIKRDKQGFLPEMVSDLYNDRVQVKKKMKKSKQELQLIIKEIEEREKGISNNYTDKSLEELNKMKKHYSDEVSALHNEQMAIKILLNALYGQLSNKYCRWFDIRLPRSITCTGQTLIRYIARRINELLNKDCDTTNKDYIITIDTDSNYVNLDGIYQTKGYTSIDQLNDYIENTLEPYIDKCYREFYDYMNHFDFQMVMKREAISDRGIFINKKKRYALSVIDMEGVRYAHPQLKIVGLEVIKSSTPEGVREPLVEVLNILLYKNRSELVEFINKFRDEFLDLPADKIAINKKVSELDKWMTEQYYEKNGKYIKLGVPINSQASINYNKLIDAAGLNLRKIEKGDKIKYVYLKSNPYNFNVIGFMDYLPKELGLDDYIDYGKQFEKTFLDNVKNITDDFGYDLNIANDFEDLWD